MHEIFQSIIDPLRTSAAVKSVFGDPVTAQGKTIIPVARIAYGFGGGSGKGVHPHKPAEGGDRSSEGEGGGGGGGVAAIPIGVFEITDAETRFIPLNDHRRLAGGLLAGLCLGMVLARRGRHVKP